MGGWKGAFACVERVSKIDYIDRQLDHYIDGWINRWMDIDHLHRLMDK